MRSRRRMEIGLAAMAAAMVGAVGCAYRSPRLPCPPPALTLPDAARSNVEQNILTFPTAGSVDQSTLPMPPYKSLTAAQVQCLAAANMPLAHLNLLEREQVQGHRLLRRDEQAAALRRDLLAYTAEELQNRTAGAALELYFRAAEAEGKSDLLNEGLKHLDDAVRDTKRMIDQQLQPPVELAIWERQELQARTDRLQAQMAIDQLNGELRALIGANQNGSAWRVWNPEGYHVPDVSIDIEAAVAEGLSRRADLALLRRLHSGLNSQTLPEVRDGLRSIYPLLGVATEPAYEVVHKLAELVCLIPGPREEVAVRRRQIADYLRTREHEVAQEVRRAAETLAYRGRLVALARQRERNREQQVREITSRRDEGLASFAQVVQAQLEWNQSRAELIEEVMAWQIAHSKLRQAQGVLAAECADGRCCAPLISPRRGR